LFNKKSGIAIIGAGKIANSICAALLKSGYRVSAVISKKKSSAEIFAEKFKIGFSSDNLQSLTGKTKIFFLTVPDNVIEKTAGELSKLDLDFKNSLFIHVSGALNINELKSLKKKKAHTGSFHIMQTFPSQEIVEIKNCPVSVEAEEKRVKDFFNKLASDLKLKPFYLESDKKIYYHLAGVFASNFLAGNIFSAEKLFSLTKSKQKDFFSVINSTINSTLGNIIKEGPAKALSGPVERGDYETIEKHLKALRREDQTLGLNYIVQSLSLINVSKEKYGKLNEGQKMIRDLLTKELNQIKKV
jgi:predicted short-subunit dehydrogenase-like oxidoreductase (DUF2520 family)